MKTIFFCDIKHRKPKTTEPNIHNPNWSVINSNSQIDGSGPIGVVSFNIYAYVFISRALIAAVSGRKPIGSMWQTAFP